MIIRREYLEKIKSAMWDGNIKVITGLRRSGKSTLLFDIFYEFLVSSGVKEENLKDSDKFYLFIDEVQMSKKTVIKNEYGSDEVSIYDMLNELKGYKNLDVYVTGSNSKMLSSDIATEFRGRSTQIHVYPLS